MSNLFKFIGVVAALSGTLMACQAQDAQTNYKETVEVFYDYLSNPGSETHAAEFKSVTAENWESVGNYSGKNKTTDAFIGQLGYFDQLIPDLDWQVQKMHQDGNTVIVRSRATGTPVAPLFGVDGGGKSFDILTIDIHELKSNKIVRTYHVEDWSGALQQLTSPEAAQAQADQAQGQKSLAIVQKFMGAMGSGDMDAMTALMHDDIVWHNEGDKRIPWLGPWTGKAEILNFLGDFSSGAKPTLWETQDVLANGDTVTMFGNMKLLTTASGEETNVFTFALRAKVKDDKVVLWNWLEDSYAVSEAFNG